MDDNIILNTDSYKHSHFLQYPPGTQYVYSYIESRGGEFDRIVFFGLQMFILKYLSKPITRENIDEAEKVCLAHGLPFNREGWEYILYELGGKLPLEIRAVPEGFVVPVKNVLATVVNTDPKCFWLTSFIETAMLRSIWPGVNVATISWHIRNMINKFMEETSDDPSGAAFKLHDFGGRGVSSFESAGICGLGHLISFSGTDTMTALVYGKEYYNAEKIGFSIPASEHSTMTSWGKENEAKAYKNMIDKFKDGGIFACVSDSYDIFNATTNIWGGELKDDVINSGAILVERPDSGDPVQTPIKVIQLLDEKFGHKVNKKGYKVLNNVRVIQGDGTSFAMILETLTQLKELGYSTENIAFGMGGALLQKHDRDTQRFAMKCSAVCIDGIWHDVQKNPIGDSGKRSKAGRLALIRDDNDEFKTVVVGYSAPARYDDVMSLVFKNGSVERFTEFSVVRDNANTFR